MSTVETGTDKILSHIEDGIGHIVFNNPEKRNAVSMEMWQAVDQALDAFAVDPAVSVVVLSGAGGKAFVSGADVSKFENERATQEAVARYSEVTAAVYAKTQAFAKPTIARIQGYCVGGGVALALCCDMRICGETSKFAVPAAKLGLGYSVANVKRAVDILGPSNTKEVFFTARMFTAGEAQGMGLVNRVVPEAQLDDYVADYAARIAANAPLTIAAIKATVAELAKDEAERDIARCNAMIKACFASQDYIEGRRAFMEKRAPKFAGS